MCIRKCVIDFGRRVSTAEKSAEEKSAWNRASRDLLSTEDAECRPAPATFGGSGGTTETSVLVLAVSGSTSTHAAAV